MTIKYTPDVKLLAQGYLHFYKLRMKGRLRLSFIILIILILVTLFDIHTPISYVELVFLTFGIAASICTFAENAYAVSYTKRSVEEYAREFAGSEIEYELSEDYLIRKSIQGDSRQIWKVFKGFFIYRDNIYIIPENDLGPVHWIHKNFVDKGQFEQFTASLAQHIPELSINNK